MKLAYVIRALSTQFLITTATLAISLSKPGCQEKCGNITIPYPFGIGPGCSANSSFEIICNNSIPTMSSIKMEVINISILGTVTVKQLVSPMKCSSLLTSGNLPTSLVGSPFTISARYNSLVVFGCQNSVWLGVNKTSTLGGCTAICDANPTERSCNGVNCCQIMIPKPFKELNYSYKTTEATNDNTSLCGYVFPAAKKLLDRYYERYSALLNKFEFAPVVLEWEYGELKGYTNHTCSYSHDYCLSIPDESGSRYASNNSVTCSSTHINDYCSTFPDRYYCLTNSRRRSFSFEDDYERYNSNYYSSHDDYVSSTKYCSCPDGYEGNPYLSEGCRDIDECNDEPRKNTCGSLTCINVRGDYYCEDTNGTLIRRVAIALIIIGCLIGTFILLLTALELAKFISKRIKVAESRDGS